MQDLAAELRRAQRKFDKWRAGRPNARTPIPDKLWRTAVGLCRAHSVHEVRSALGLDYAKLKAKMSEAEKPGQSRGCFVSVKLPPMTSSGPVCEWVRQDGAKLRVRISTLELGRVVAEFFGGHV